MSGLAMTRALDGVAYVQHVLYTVSGTGAPWDAGYPADMARELEATGLYQWQGVSYGPNGIPAAFPMQSSINSGDTEMARLMQLRSPLQTWGFISYSQGAIVTSDILDRCGITHNPAVQTDLADYAASFIGGVTFGNPRREAGHTIPGGIDNGGQGIVTPNLVGTPESVWDMADDKAMVGSPGNDLYTKAGEGGTAQSLADERAVWNIVDTGNPLSLAEAVAKLLLQPSFSGGYAAAVAAFQALDFFVVQGIQPHTSYQFAQPLPNDPRDCWAVGLDYLTALGAQIPARTAA